MVGEKVMKKFKWVQFIGNKDVHDKLFRDKQTGNVLKGLICDHLSNYWYGYSETTGEVDGYPQSRLEVQVEAGYLYQAFNAKQYKLIEWEVVNQDGDVVNKTDILVGSNKAGYILAGELFVVYLNGRQNIQEVHFSDLLLRKEV